MSGSVLAAACLGRRAEETLPLTATAITFILFVFYCLDILAAGRIAVLILCAGCYIAAAFFLLRDGYKLKKITELFSDKKFNPRSFNKSVMINFSGRIFTPGFVLFIFGLGMLLFLSQNSGVFRFDELRLWGVYPKILYFTEQLQTGDNNLLIFPTMNQYLPGMPLFQYFVLRCLGEFSDKGLLFASGLICLTLLMPVTKRINWKQSCVTILACTALVTLLQVVMGSNVSGHYATLFIDGPVGFFAGYLFYLALCRPFSDRFATLRFCLGLAVIPMMKESGSLFSFLAAAAAIALEISCYNGFNKNLKLRTRERTLRYSLITFISAIFPMAIWKIISQMFDLYRIQDFSAPFSFKYIGDFLYTIAFSPIVSGIGIVSLGAVYLILTCISYGLYRMTPKEKRKPFLIISAGLAIANFGFLCGLYTLAVMNWGGEFNSFRRYIITALAADLTFAVCCALRLILDRDLNLVKQKHWHTTAVTSVCSLLILVIPIYQVLSAMPSSAFISEADEMHRFISSTLPDLPNGDYLSAPKLLVVFPDEMVSGEDDYYYTGIGHRIYYDSIGSNYFAYGFTYKSFILPEFDVFMAGADREDDFEGLDYQVQQWLRDTFFDTGIEYVCFYQTNGPVGAALTAHFARQGVEIYPRAVYHIGVDENGRYVLYLCLKG